MTRVNIVKLVNIVKIVQNWCLGQGSPLPCSCYRPAAGATLQGLCRKGYADDNDDDKDADDDGDDMMLLICSLKVVGAQRGSVLNSCCCVLHRLGVMLLGFASLKCHFAAFRIA